MEQKPDGMWFWRCRWHDGQQMIEEETLGVMPAERWYVYGNLIDEVISEWHSMNGGWWQQWYLTDALGSVYVLTDNNGNVVEAYHYSIYGSPKVYAPDGTPRALTNYDNRILFTSREYIWQLHLYYYRFRWYNPCPGRFLQRDPLSWMNYAYCAGNPVRYIDPTGLQKTEKEKQEDKKKPAGCVKRVVVFVLLPLGPATRGTDVLENALEKEGNYKVDLICCGKKELLNRIQAENKSVVGIMIVAERAKHVHLRGNRWRVVLKTQKSATDKFGDEISPDELRDALNARAEKLTKLKFLIVAACYTGVWKPHQKYVPKEVLDTFEKVPDALHIETFSAIDTTTSVTVEEKGSRRKVSINVIGMLKGCAEHVFAFPKPVGPKDLTEPLVDDNEFRQIVDLPLKAPQKPKREERK